MPDDDARAEAERRYTGRRMHVGTMEDREVYAFQDGAAWQASRTPVVADRECDGGCNYGDGPMEDCSLHGRPVAEVWAMFATANAELAALRAAPVVADVDADALIADIRDLEDDGIGWPPNAERPSTRLATLLGRATDPHPTGVSSDGNV